MKLPREQAFLYASGYTYKTRFLMLPEACIRYPITLKSQQGHETEFPQHLNRKGSRGLGLTKPSRSVADDKYYARADLNVCSSGPRPAQHEASLPSITTAGTLRTPYSLAFFATSLFCISCTATSCDEPASRFTISIVSLHVPQPALKTSIFLLPAITIFLPFFNLIVLFRKLDMPRPPTVAAMRSIANL